MRLMEVVCDAFTSVVSESLLICTNSGADTHSSLFGSQAVQKETPRNVAN